MKKFLKTSLYISVVFFVTLFLLEDACQLYVRLLKPELMTKYEELQNPQVARPQSTQTAKFKPSPYFGYVSTEGNNFGFISPEDFPVVRNKDTYVVAILGGSVAYHLANYILKNPSFAEQMKKSIPALKDKDIHFMGLALPGYKQPQQYIILSYFLEQIDMAIQIDGWNEVFVTSAAGSPVDYPAMMYEQNPTVAEKFKPASGLKISVIKAIADNGLLKKSMALFLLKNSLEYKIFLENQAKTKIQKTTSLSPVSGQDGSAQVAIWSKYIRHEKILLKSNNKKGYFFVQASQYNPGSKVLTEEEKKAAVNPLIEKLVAPKFQLLRAEAKKIDVYDMADVFRNEKSSVYIDNCCHVNEHGNKMATEEILKVISKNFKN